MGISGCRFCFYSFLVFSLKFAKEGYVISLLAAMVSSALFSFLLISAVICFPALGEKTFSNPAQIQPFSIETSVNKEEMNAKIAETIGVDKVSVKVDDGGDRAVKSYRSGFNCCHSC